MPLTRTTLSFNVDLIEDGESVVLAELTDASDSEHDAGLRRSLDSLFRGPHQMGPGSGFDRPRLPLAPRGDRTTYDPVPTFTATAKRHPNDAYDAALGRNLAVTRALRRLTSHFEREIPVDCRDKDNRLEKLARRLAKTEAERDRLREESERRTPDEDSNLVRHARAEMAKVGLYDTDADYGGMLAQAVEDLVRVFASQGHSGGSAFAVRELFAKLTNFEPLSPLTNDPDEWMNVSELSGSEMYQSRRRPDAFSTDGGKTYYLLGDSETMYTSEPHQAPDPGEVADAEPV